MVTLLTVAQAAERACVSSSLIYEWCSSGVLPHLRLGKAGKRGCIRIAAGDLDSFLAGCKVEGPAEDEGPLRHIGG